MIALGLLSWRFRHLPAQRYRSRTSWS